MNVMTFVALFLLISIKDLYTLPICLAITNLHMKKSRERKFYYQN